MRRCLPKRKNFRLKQQLLFFVYGAKMFRVIAAALIRPHLILLAILLSQNIEELS